jgi:hypothetical protein
VVRHHRGSVFRLSSRRVLASTCAPRATGAGSKELRRPGRRPVIHRNLPGFSVTQQCINNRLTSCRHPGSTHTPVVNTNICPVCSGEQAQCPLGHQQPFGTSRWRSNCTPPCAAKYLVSPPSPMIRHVTHDPTRDTEHHKQGVSSTGGFHPELEHPK